MYEFTKKEIRSEFKKTNYGKKTNTYILIGYICFFILLILSIIFTITLDTSLKTLYVPGRMAFEVDMSFVCYLLYGATALSCILLVYLDGKRDGAIIEYKECKK